MKSTTSTCASTEPMKLTRTLMASRGGGGALLWEKIVNNASTKRIWIVDESKLVKRIGNFGVPMEVIPFGDQHVFNYFAKQGYHPAWRLTDDGAKYRTDEKNFIIDLKVGEIADPKALVEDLIHTVGVVEHGLFLSRVDQVIVGRQDGPEVLDVN